MGIITPLVSSNLRYHISLKVLRARLNLIRCQSLSKFIFCFTTLQSSYCMFIRSEISRFQRNQNLKLNQIISVSQELHMFI